MYPLDVYIGKIAPYAGDSPSAIAKHRTTDELLLTSLGLQGDEQAEKRFHGGPDRALCHYPREHYADWINTFPETSEKFTAPAFGENLSTLGLTEHNVHIGDVFRWGEAMIQVTQPRSPCHKLNFHFTTQDMALQLQNSGRCGWLYRVIATGKVSSTHPLELISRSSDMSVAEAIAIAFHQPFDTAQYRRLLGAAGLSASWSKTMLIRIARGTIEDASFRLHGRTA